MNSRPRPVTVANPFDGCSRCCRLLLVHRQAPALALALLLQAGPFDLPPQAVSFRTHGFIFVGLFETPIPQARPVACAIATESGFYQIEDAPEGEFYLFALGLEHPIDTSACFDYDSALRGGGHQVRIGSHAVHGTTSLYLRPPSPLDPPILIVLSLLLDEFFSHKHRIPPLALTALPLAVHAQG